MQLKYIKFVYKKVEIIIYNYHHYLMFNFILNNDRSYS